LPTSPQNGQAQGKVGTRKHSQAATWKRKGKPKNGKGVSLGRRDKSSGKIATEVFKRAEHEKEQESAGAKKKPPNGARLGLEGHRGMPGEVNQFSRGVHREPRQR